MRFDPFGRRLFLTGLGGATLALPFLPSLLPRALRRVVEAQPATPPRRFIAIKSYNGAPVLDYYPTVAPTGYGTHSGDGTVALSSPLPVPTGRHSNGTEYFGHAAPLSDFASTGLSNVFGSAFDSFFDQMLLLRGLDFMPLFNHNHGGFLGNLGLRTRAVGGAMAGAQINATIDYVMSRSAGVYPSGPAGPRVLHLGSRLNTCSFAPKDLSRPLEVGLQSVQQAQAYVNPRLAFDSLFDASAPEPSGTPWVSGRLIDRVLEDYRRAMAGPNLSSSDRRLLDQHITHLTELDNRLGGGPPISGCDVGAPPSGIDTGGEFDVDPAAIAGLWDNMVDVLVLALACDTTRIATFDIAKMVVEANDTTFGMGDSENANFSGRSNWHFQAHKWDDNAIRWLGAGNRWIAQTVVQRLLSRMEQVSESDGESLLHHSIVLWGNELSANHLCYSIPTALFGRGGGTLKSGRYIDYIDHNRPVRFRQHNGAVVEGVQYNRLLVTIMQAMGLTPDEYERETGRGFGESRTLEKNAAWATDYDDSNVGQPLPDLLV